MSDFLLARKLLKVNSKVRLVADHPCNFLLLDDANYKAFQSGKKFKHFGGFMQRYPADIVVPRSGHWNVILDLDEGVEIGYDLSFIDKK